MAFKKAPPPSEVTDSPEKLFLELPRRKIPDVLPHQKDVMQSYVARALKQRDVALQLPTGSGKTLVGLLIGEWRRRRNSEKVVYLCPTRQLVNQVVEQGTEKYGLTVLGFTGSIRDYEPAAKAKYNNGDNIAVTTYSSVFNTNPYFKDADVIIFDDAHAAEQYVAALWSLRIDRSNPEHSATHVALRSLLKGAIPPANFRRLCGISEGLADISWVDKISTPKLFELHDEIIEVLDTHTQGNDLRYPWSMIRDHLLGCHVYLSTNEIYIRPLIPPTWTHAPFENAKQRIYMSATLGAGGDLERLMGRKSISRLPIPDGWDRQGVGRRFFIFPSLSLNENDTKKLRQQLIQKTDRSLVLVPNDKARLEIADEIKTTIAYKTFSADDIEESKQSFVRSKKSVAIVANRYDGIDFPGAECRLLFIEGLPKTTNIQERFLMSRMGANILFNERIQVRVLQAIGRCTRSLEDYSAVIVTGADLPEYLSSKNRRKYLHPELQAEISFGVEQSKDSSLKDLVENFEIFIKNGEAWEKVNEQIVAERKRATQEDFPAIDNLAKVVAHEIEFQKAVWQGDYGEAYDEAEQVLSGLINEDLRGYRALWHYIAGSTASLGAAGGSAALKAKARTQFAHAKKAAIGIPWLVALSQEEDSSEGSPTQNPYLVEQIERVEMLLEQLGTVHDRNFAVREKEIVAGLSREETFERGQKLLGELLGFQAGKIESDASPDPWWICRDICIVFEDHAGALPDSALGATKARQVQSHPAWMKANVDDCKNPGMKIIPVLVTPAATVKEGAMPHLDGVALWSVSDFREWANRALVIVREIRRTFSEAGDLAWRAQASGSFEQQGLDALSLYNMLMKMPASKALKPEKK